MLEVQACFRNKIKAVDIIERASVRGSSFFYNLKKSSRYNRDRIERASVRGSSLF